MSVNYYIEYPACPCCGRSDDRYHIGKSSFGWAFMLHVDPDLSINSLEDVMAEAKKGLIISEYGSIIPMEEMLDTITNRPAISELIRLVIGDNCIGHGPGSWDLIAGNFS